MNEQDWILKNVQEFYDIARDDILIGYHFRNIKDFESHIPRIAIFWEIQLLGKYDQKIDPPFDMISAHMPLGIKRGEIGRWLLLFRKILNKNTHEFPDLSLLWEEKLQFFEKIFLRTFST